MTHWKRDTALIMIVLVIMFLFVGLVFGLVFGSLFDCVEYLTIRAVGIMFIISIITLLACYAAVPRTPKALPDWIVLSREENPRLFARVDEMCAKAGIPTPKLYITDDPFPNAYALGRSPDQAHVCMTRGLVNTLDDEEIYAILGHELSHIAHRDTVVKGVARNCTNALSVSAIIVGIVSIMFLGSANAGSARSGSGAGGMFYLIILAIALAFVLFAAILIVTIPGAAVVTHFGVSKNREYLADAGSANINGHPEHLISALRKIDSGCLEGNANIKAADAMMWTVNPNGKKRRGSFMQSLLSTHPSTEDRIKRLESIMAKSSPTQPKVGTVPQPQALPAKVQAPACPPAPSAAVPAHPVGPENTPIYNAIRSGATSIVDMMLKEGFAMSFSGDRYEIKGIAHESFVVYVSGMSKALMAVMKDNRMESEFFNFMARQCSRGWSSLSPRFMDWDRSKLYGVVPAECSVQCIYDEMVGRGLLDHTSPRPVVSISWNGSEVTDIRF